MNREADQPLVQCVAHRQIARSEADVAANGVVVDRHIVDLHADTRFAKVREYPGASIDCDREKVISVTRSYGSGRRETAR